MTPSPLEVGALRLIDDVAHGAGGTMYKAQDVASGRLIALKVLEGKSEARADAEPRLLAEAKYASALGLHANIVRPVRWGHLPEAGARPFMATEFVDGPDPEPARRRLPCTHPCTRWEASCARPTTPSTRPGDPQ